MEYVEHTEDPLMQIVRTHQYNIGSTLFHTTSNLQKSPQSDRKQIKTTIARNMKERYVRLHGQIPPSLDERLIDKEQSYRWLKFGDIKGETKGTVMSAHDQAICTDYFMKKILNKKLKVNADCVKNMKRLLTT
jgi:hypothetical protein